jgi:hypothetical protein
MVLTAGFFVSLDTHPSRFGGQGCRPFHTETSLCVIVKLAKSQCVTSLPVDRTFQHASRFRLSCEVTCN